MGRTSSGSRRRLARLGAAALVAAALTSGCSGEGEPRPSPAGAPAPDPALTRFVPEDPAQVRRREAREEALARYRALRNAFAGGGAPSPASARRLEAALAAAGPERARAMKLACRGLVCRVTSAGELAAWAPALEADAGVRAVAERIASDPDGAENAVYVLLAAPDATGGDALLAEAERALLDAPEARECARAAGAAGTVRYELRVDRSGFTFRADGDLPWPAVDCVNGVLGDILRTIPVPPSARSATRVVALRL